MTCTTMCAARPFLFFMLLFIVGSQQQAWPDEYPSPPDANMPAVSPDGKKIVFESDNLTRKTTIWIADRDGSDTHPLVKWPESVQMNPDWSPDGQYVVFASDRDSQDRNIWRVNADGSNSIKLTSEGDNSYPDFRRMARKFCLPPNGLLTADFGICPLTAVISVQPGYLPRLLLAQAGRRTVAH